MKDFIEIGHVRVFTKSLTKAAHVAAKVKRTRQSGEIDGVRFECLTIPLDDSVTWAGKRKAAGKQHKRSKR